MAFNINEFMADRNIQNALAGFGAGLDPQGVGGALGNATISMNKSKAMQESVAKTEKEDKDFRSQLLALLGGGMTPAGTPGMTSATVKGNEITMKGDLPSNAVTGAENNPANVSNNQSRLRELSPFFSALIGQ